MSTSVAVGPLNQPRCPKCGNSLQNAIPGEARNFRRCADCKTVFALNQSQLVLLESIEHLQNLLDAERKALAAVTVAAATA